MQSRNNRRITELLRSPVGLLVVILVVAALVGLVVMSVMRFTRGNENIEASYDAVAEDEVYTAPVTNGRDSAEIVRYIGTFELLMKNGVTPEQYVVFKDAMVGYAEENGVDLKRVSYVEGSFNKTSECLYDMKVVLNEGYGLLDVKIDATTDCGGTKGLKIIINKEQGGQ